VCKWPKREEQKILLVPNPANPLKSSSEEKAIQKAGFVLLRLPNLEVGNDGLENLQSLDFANPEPGSRRLTSFKQLVCKIKQEIHHQTSN
jgi:hypothetical protein